MIAVDTSALMAILLREPESEACIGALERADDLLISAGTVAEALVVAGRRQLGAEMARLLDELGFVVAPMTLASARGVAQAYHRWGKGRSPAALNLGDCFAYELASSLGCPLLFVGRDFAQTDIEGVL